MPQSTGRYKLTLGLAVLLAAVAACSQTKPKEPVAAAAQPSARFGKTEGAAVLEAEPYTQADRQQALFSADLWDKGVLPVHVNVRNNGDKPFTVDPQQFRLGLPSGEVIAPLATGEIVKALTAEGGTLGQVGMGIGQLGASQIGQLAGPFGSVAGFAASKLFGLLYSHTGGDHPNASPGEFKAATLGKNQFSRGFVFFALPQGSAHPAAVSFSIGLLDHQTETQRLEIQLTGL